MNSNQIKTANGITIIGLAFIISMTVILVSAVKFDKDSIYITNIFSNKTQLALISGADSGLIGWWKFDEGVGSSVADSSRSNTGSLMNNPTWITGKIGTGAIQFDGTDDYADLTNSYSSYVGPSIDTSADTMPSFSISAWANKAASRHISRIIFGKVGSNVGILEGQFSVWSTSGQRSINYTSTVGTWYLATMTYDNQTHILTGYINGSVIGMVDMTGLTFKANTNKLIAGGTSGWNFSGSIDDVRIYDRALSAGDVLEIYNYVENGNPGGGQGGSDNQVPSAPTNITGNAASSSQIDLSWTASTDNVGVVGYKVYRNSTEIGDVSGTTYSDSNLSPSTQYNYSVSAYDAANNLSDPSGTISITTQAPSVSQAAGNILYVNKSGSDTNPCSQASPCLTISGGISKMFSTGKTELIIGAGTYNERINPGTGIPSGTNWNNVVKISGATGEQVIVQAPDAGVGVAGTNLSSGSYIKFDNIIFDGSNLTKAPVIKITGTAQYIKFSNCEVRNSKRSHGILLTSDVESHAWITNCRIHDNGTETQVGDSPPHNIYSSSGGNIFEYLKLYNNNHGWGIHIYDGDMSDNIVRYNEFYDLQGDGGVIVSGGNNNLIYNNIFHDIYAQGIRVDRANDVRIINNTFYENGNALTLGYFLGSPARTLNTNIKIYNNLIYNSGLRSRMAVWIAPSSKDTIFKNNIVYGSQYYNSSNYSVDVLDAGTGSVITGNMVGTSNDPGSTGINPLSAITNSLAGNYDPKFLNATGNDFHLLSSSPAIDHGLTQSEVVDDFSGTSRPQGSAYDIGAYETQSSGSVGNTSPSNTGSNTNTQSTISTSNTSPNATTTATTTSRVVPASEADPVIITSSSLIAGKSSEIIRLLQQTLNAKGFTVSPTGAGSKGNETTYFGIATQNALKRYQCTKMSLCSGVTYGVLDSQTATSLGITLTTPTTTSYKFTRPLKLGYRGDDVKNLQIFLNTKGFTVSTTGAGSKGNETTYFGVATQKALIKFQEAYKTEILTPYNLTKGTGYFGVSTIKKVREINK